MCIPNVVAHAIEIHTHFNFRTFSRSQFWLTPLLSCLLFACLNHRLANLYLHILVPYSLPSLKPAQLSAYSEHIEHVSPTHLCNRNIKTHIWACQEAVACTYVCSFSPHLHCIRNIFEHLDNTSYLLGSKSIQSFIQAHRSVHKSTNLLTEFNHQFLWAHEAQPRILSDLPMSFALLDIVLGGGQYYLLDKSSLGAQISSGNSAQIFGG
jgi:hypothetical protein